MGTIQTLLPQVQKWNKTLLDADPARFERLSRAMLARTTVYNIPLYLSRTDPEMLALVNRAYSHFDWLKGTRFVAPGESHRYLQNPAENPRVGLYLNDQADSLMMVVSNFSDDPIEKHLSLKRQSLKEAGVDLPPDARFLNAVTLEPADVADDRDGLRAALPGDDFRMFIVR